MTVETVNGYVNTPNRRLKHSFHPSKKNISYGYINLEKSDDVKLHAPKATKKDTFLASIGAIIGAGSALALYMKQQKIKNPLHVKYSVFQMLFMAATANAGGILLNSIGKDKADNAKKWKEAAFQMVLTSAPMLLVDGAIKICERTKKLNNNFAKLVSSAIGVIVGSKSALIISNKLRNKKEEINKPKRKLKMIDMVANLDDIVAMLVLAKIPFADKIHIERALPVIYSFCGYRSGTGDRN